MSALATTEILEYTVIGVYCVVFMLNTLFILLGMYFQKHYGKQFNNNLLISFAWCSMISYSICVLLQLIGVFLPYINSLSNAFYGTGYLFVYLLFIFRVKITFDDTIYQLKSYLYIIAYVLVFINWTIYIVTTVAQFMYSMNTNDKTITQQQFGISYLIQSIMGLLFDIILSISFIWIFIYKLLQSTTKVMLDTYDADKSSQISLTFSEKKMINVVVKSFFLSFIAIISAQIAKLQFLIYDTIYILYGYDYDSFQSNNVYYILIMIYTMDTTVNILCILLQFKFMENVYLAIYPKCHERISTYCKRYAMRKVDQLKSSERSVLNDNFVRL